MRRGRPEKDDAAIHRRALAALEAIRAQLPEDDDPWDIEAYFASLTSLQRPTARHRRNDSDDEDLS